MKRSKIALVLAACLGLSALPNAPAAGAAATAEKPYYIIDEEFAFMRGKDWPILAARPSGWTVDDDGGELTSGYNSWFRIDDKSDLLPVEMCKWFKAEADGFYSLEYRFKFVKLMENTSWRVRCGEKSAVSFIISNGRLCIETAGERMTLSNIVENIEYGVRADFDLPTKTIGAVYVNGALKAENIGFRDNVGALDNFQVLTGEKAVGAMLLTPIKLYKNFAVNERLISTVEGSLPSDWALSGAGGTAKVAKINSTTPPDFFSLKISDNSAAAAVSISKSVPAQHGPFTFEFKMMFENKADGVSGGVFAGEAKVFEISTLSGGFAYAAGGARTPVPGYDSYLENLWYSFRVVLDIGAGKADLWINGRKAAVGIDLPGDAGAADRLIFESGREATGVLWLDDIVLAANPPLPEDYVPLPINNAAADDYLIGMQNCSLWREGHHLGWDFISGWPERKPILGFYDEGSTEAADWQTKFLVENGVDFQLTSWFRPNMGRDAKAPVKDPYTAVSALHEGYFYSEYSEMLKYMIYWENGGGPSWAAGSEDFRKNFVPFWMEYYFKDPRYLKIDNKPVLAILTYSGLENNFGAAANIKAEMDYLRAECVKAGFGGAYIISLCGSPTVEDMELRKESGLDALYYYGHNFDGISADAQRSKMNTYKSVGVMDVIANLSANQNYTAWGLESSLFRGGNMEPDEFYRLSRWLKDEYMPSCEGINKKMALLGIWNEYGEGSYMMPCPELYGFGYLDAFRRAFLPGAQANNIAPSEASIARMGRLYSEPGRAIAPISDPRENLSETTVKKGWYFETDGDFEGWGVTWQTGELAVEGGMISGVATGIDPGIISPDNLGINIDNIPFIRVKQKNSIAYAEGQIYFITESDQAWNEAKSVRYSAAGGAGELIESLVYMGTNKNWKGTLKRIRFDPFDRSPGDSFSYDAIELLEAAPKLTPVPTPFPTPPAPPVETPYTRAGENAVPNYGFDYDFGEGIAAKSAGASYAFGVWPGLGQAAGGKINDTTALMLDLNNMTRDEGGDYVEVRLREGFAFETGKRYGVYFWGYAPERPYINASNPNDSGGAALNLRWNDLYFGNNRYHKSTQINANSLTDAAGWIIKSDIIDMNNLGGYAVQAGDIRGNPTLRLCYNGGPTSSEPGAGLFAYDNIYLTEIAGEPAIHEVRPVFAGENVIAIDVELEYMIDWLGFLGEGIVVRGENGIAWALGAELLKDNMTIRIGFADPLDKGAYTVTLGDNVADLWGRQFADNKTAAFEVVQAEPVANLEVGSFGIFSGAKEITDGALPESSAVSAKAANIKNNTEQRLRVNLILALYQGGAVIDARINSADIEAGAEAALLTAELSTPQFTDGDYSLKAFLWEGLGSLAPVQMLSAGN